MPGLEEAGCPGRRGETTMKRAMGGVVTVPHGSHGLGGTDPAVLAFLAAHLQG